jgi:hypothetical protein
VHYTVANAPHVRLERPLRAHQQDEITQCHEVYKINDLDAVEEGTWSTRSRFKVLQLLLKRDKPIAMRPIGDVG